MKNYVIGCFVLLFLLMGCSKTKEVSELPAEDDFFQYKVAEGLDFDAFDVDEAGLVYIPERYDIGSKMVEMDGKSF